MVITLLSILILLSMSRDSQTTQSSSSLVLHYSITEKQPPGSTIAHLPSHAKVAPHLSRSSPLTFRMLGESRLSRYLHLDINSGNLSVHDVIDRDVICPGESFCVDELQVALYPSENFVAFKVIINIEDINDNPPRFSEMKYHVIIPEDSSPGDKVLLPTAIDVDSPENGIAEYRLPSAPVNFRLEMNELNLGDEDTRRPYLVLNRELDRETRDRYVFYLVCYDSGRPRLSGSTVIEVEVGDVNDNNPVFERSNYDVIVPEDAPIGMTIMRVKAVDADAGLNGKVRYSLSQKSLSNYGETFVIDEERGDVVLLQNLDHSRQPAFNISIVARDRSESPVPVMASLSIIVNDVNDHSPQITVDFLTESGKMELSENQLPGVFVGHVSVSDADDELNGDVVCNLDNDELKLVAIYLGEFKLVSNKIFDREEQDRYEIILRCHDKGSPQLWSNKTMTLHILDLNDNPPIFEQSIYEVSVPESLKPGSIVLKIVASDDDQGEHGQMFYSILPFDGEDVTKTFHIDSESGVIITANELDRERIEVYEFHVIADNFDSKLRVPRKDAMTSKCLVRITLSDVDDNGPHFTQRNFTFLVAENLPTRTIVGTLTARDADLPPNDGFVFRLVMTGDGIEEIFSVDSSTGLISTWRSLDREIKEFYSMRVEVYSTTDSTKNDTANVFIRVDDRNDNSPVFVFPSSHNNNDNNLNIFINHPIGAEVIAFAASDADVGDNGDLTYEMVAGNATDYFRLDRKTGSLQLSRAFQRDDVNKTFSIVVRVKDSGQHENLDSLTTMLFTIIDSNSMLLQSGMLSLWQLMSDSHFIIIASFLGLVIICIVFIIAFIAVITRKMKENRKLVRDELAAKFEDQQLSSSLLAADLRGSRQTSDLKAGIPDILDSELRIERVKVDDDEYLTPPLLSTRQQQTANHTTAVKTLRRHDEVRCHDPNDLDNHYDDTGCYVMNEINRSNDLSQIYDGGAITDIMLARKLTSQGQPHCRHHEAPFHQHSKHHHHPFHPSTLHFNHLPIIPTSINTSNSQHFAPTSAAELLSSSLLRQKNVRFSRDMPIGFHPNCGSLRNKASSSSHYLNSNIETFPCGVSKSESLRKPSPVTHQYLPVKDDSGQVQLATQRPSMR